MDKLPTRTATTLKLRVMKSPSNVRKRIAKDIANIECLSQRILRGYVRRISEDCVEVFVVSEPATEMVLAPLFVPFFQKWPVDFPSIEFNEISHDDVDFLYESKFQIIQTKGEPDTYSCFWEPNEEAFTIVSRI